MSSLPTEQAGRLLEAAGIEGASRPGHVVYGHRGGDERAAIASRFPLRALPALNDLDFPILDELKAENANARQIDPAKSLQLAIPLHEGAARYFKK